MSHLESSRIAYRIAELDEVKGEMMNREEIFQAIIEERANQDKFFGEENDDLNNANDWVAFITKHSGKALRNPFAISHFREQMVRVAALAVAALEWSSR